MKDIINTRCDWAGTDELYIKYHDEEWGRLVTDDKTLFEFLVLESAQAGLAWITILRKREGYKKAFHHFDVERHYTKPSKNQIYNYKCKTFSHHTERVRELL